MSTLRYNWMRSVAIENALIFDLTHNIFNLRYTEVVMCIILVPLKKAYDIKSFMC